MLVSTKGRYALRVMIELAGHDREEFVPLGMIAKKQDISGEYSVGQILRLTEGSLAPVACLNCAPNPCERAETCKTLPMWKKLDRLICDYLDSISIEDLRQGKKLPADPSASQDPA